MEQTKRRFVCEEVGMPQREVDRVLLLCEDPDKARGVVGLFDANGFTVRCHTGELSGVDLAGYGAVVHLAQSADALNDILGDELDNVRDEEWILIEGGTGDEDQHCTVQLTRQASHALRAFVRALWAQFSIT